MNKKFWKNKRVFITGHTGFKGSWLSLWLIRLGAQVTGYSLTESDPGLFRLAHISTGMRSVTGDVRDLQQLTACLKKARPEIVFHLAAQPLVRYSYQHPVETYQTNVMGTVNLLEAVRRTPGVRVVVVVTSDKCYENKEWDRGYREDDPMGGDDPYASSKGCAELVTTAYRRSFFPISGTQNHGVAVASARAGNVIGGGDWSTDRLVPDIIRAFTHNRVLTIRNPHSLRPWQHVLEPLSGYMLLAERLWKNGREVSEGWNFGPNDADAKSVEWIVERVVKLWGSGQWKPTTTTHPHEAHVLKLDCSKAQKRLGWKPLLSLEKALGMTVSWYREQAQTKDIRAYTEAQIAEYEALLAKNTEKYEG